MGSGPLVTVHQVRQLVEANAPHYADLSITYLDSGFDNDCFALGTDYAIRIPRHRDGADLLRIEARWVPIVAAGLTLAVSTPVFVANPGNGCEWPWLIHRRVAGSPAWNAAVLDTPEAATCLGRFCARIRRPAPHDAPFNPYRSIPLHERGDGVTHNAERLTHDSRLTNEELRRLTGIFEAGIEADGGPRSGYWSHGDLHPGNVMTLDGAVSGVIDFGDMAAADPALDLAIAWYSFSAPNRDVFFSEADLPHTDMVARSHGWAVAIALSTFARPDLPERYWTMFQRVVNAT